MISTTIFQEAWHPQKVPANSVLRSLLRSGLEGVAAHPSIKNEFPVLFWVFIPLQHIVTTCLNGLYLNFIMEKM